MIIQNFHKSEGLFVREEMVVENRNLSSYNLSFVVTSFFSRLSGQKQSFAKQLLMEQKKLEVVEKLKQKPAGDQGPRIGKGFNSGEFEAKYLLLYEYFLV